MDEMRIVRKRAAHEHYYARFHALQAVGKLEALEKKLKVSPCLKHVNRFRCDLQVAFTQIESAARTEVYWEGKLAELEDKYRPDQPRVPAGNPDGGQWTNGDGGSSGNIHAALANPRLVEPALGVPPKFPSDAIRAIPSDKEIVGAIGVLSAVAAPETRIGQAVAALRTALGLGEEAVALGDILAPEGKFVGERYKGADADTTTVSSSKFEQLQNQLMQGAKPTTQPTYEGSAFKRSDGTVFGLRNSENHGLTIDILESKSPQFLNGFRVHQR
jgi:hypothetical protein